MWEITNLTGKVLQVDLENRDIRISRETENIYRMFFSRVWS